MATNKSFFKITDDIKNLKLDNIVNNLSFYDYHSKYLKKLQKTDIDKDDVHYISTYSSFIGEVYENVIYELLLSYAIKMGCKTAADFAMFLKARNSILAL